MSSSLFFPAAKNGCLVCRKGGKLRQCAGCKTVQYCSRECQRSHWPLHKAHCSKSKEYSEDFAALRSNNPEYAKEVKAFGKFFQIWNDAIFGWGLCAADLGSRIGAGYLEKHSFYMSIERRPDAPADAPVKCMYEVITAGMRPNEDILGDFEIMEKERGFPAAKANFLAHFEGPQLPGLTPAFCLRVVIVQPSLCLSTCSMDLLPNIIPEEKVVEWCENSVLSSALESTWLQSCKESVKKGITSGHHKLIRELDSIG
ncbi:hypothetical protein C8F01DRAFT_1119132 [Mycena amicta]|nr:hypothetical protein C8F01DRAFT_1119132 [Mycena amicta]